MSCDSPVGYSRVKGGTKHNRAFPALVVKFSSAPAVLTTDSRGRPKIEEDVLVEAASSRGHIFSLTLLIFTLSLCYPHAMPFCFLPELPREFVRICSVQILLHPLLPGNELHTPGVKCLRYTLSNAQGESIRAVTRCSQSVSVFAEPNA